MTWYKGIESIDDLDSVLTVGLKVIGQGQGLGYIVKAEAAAGAVTFNIRRQVRIRRAYKKGKNTSESVAWGFDAEDTDKMVRKPNLSSAYPQEGTGSTRSRQQPVRENAH